MDKPKLRPIEIIQAKNDKGEHFFAIRDYFQLTKEMVVAPAEKGILILLSLFDGTKEIRDIQSEYVRQTGDIIYTEQISGICAELSKAYLLEDDNFQNYMKNEILNFMESPVRKPSFAGSAYPAAKEEIIKFFDSFFPYPEGPGLIKTDPEKNDKILKAIIAPHIDFYRGGFCSAYAYKELAENPPADIYIILGVAHLGGGEKFIATNKDFETPLGISKTDKDFIDKIKNNYSGDLFIDEFTHKSEHSIEFQVVFLQYLFNNKHNFTIVPVLCSSFHDAIKDNISPMEIPQVKSFVESVKKAIKDSGKKVCIISGSDLSHMGKKFGDNQKMDSDFIEWLDIVDNEMIDIIKKPDAEMFFHDIKKDNDKRRVCGFPSIYTTLNILENIKEIKLLKYSKDIDEETDSCVSFASIAFYE